MSHNPQKLKRCPACEGITGQRHLPDCFAVAANKLWSNLNVLLTSPVSQPDGYAGESQAITPEPERNAFAGQPYDTQPNSLPRTTTGYTRASGPGPYATGRVTIQKEDGSYERVPRAGTPTPLYRAVLGPDGIPSLELVSDSPTAREIALEERLQQAHETIAQQFNTIETLKLVVSELKAGRNVMHLLDSLMLRSRIVYHGPQPDIHGQVAPAHTLRDV